MELNHQADDWDRRDETHTSYSQTPLKLETVFSSKVSSSLVKENICKCWFKQFDSRSKGRTDFRITQGKRRNEPCKFSVKQFFSLQIYFKVQHLHEGLNIVIVLQTFCGNILILVQIQKPTLASTGNHMWNPNSLSPFEQGSLWKDSSEESKRLGHIWHTLSYRFLIHRIWFYFWILPGTSQFLDLLAFYMLIYLFIFNWLGSPLEIFHEIPDLSCSDIPMNGRKTVCSAERL